MSSSPIPPVTWLPVCWGIWKVICAFWMQERDREEWGGRIRSQTLGFWLEMRKLEALCQILSEAEPEARFMCS